MDTLIDQIRASLADDASEDAHHAGAAACRKILAALEARRPSTAPPPTPPRSPNVGTMPALAALKMPRAQLLDFVIAKLHQLQPEATATPAIGTAITALRSLSLDQVVDLGITKLRSALTAEHGAGIPPGARLIHLAPVTPVGPGPRRVP